MKVWVNDEVREEGALIDTRDRGFLLGDGAFETLYVEAGRPAFLAEHLRRLRSGLEVLQMPVPENLSSVSAIIARLAGENGFDSCASARITVTRGSGARGLVFPKAEEVSPTLLVTVGPARAPSSTPLRLLLSARRRFAGAATARFKAIGGYADNILAFNEAAKEGADEALMLNEGGRIAGASTANLFAIDNNGAVLTPSLGEGALPGVVRAVLLAGDHGVGINEGALAPDALQGRALFITNSLRGVCSAQLGADGASPAQSDVLRRLQTWYQERLRREVSETGEAGR